LSYLSKAELKSDFYSFTWALYNSFFAGVVCFLVLLWFTGKTDEA
jgi:uncharacterized membrane protein YdcZ (DUF606 family)